MKRVFREIVCAMIFSKDERLLMVRKDPAKGGVYPNCWQIPGGGVEPGETTRAALNREIQEEIGLNINALERQLIDDSGIGSCPRTAPSGESYIVDMRFAVYRIELPTAGSETEIHLGPELSEYRWVALNELSALKLTPPGVELLTKLGMLR